METNGANKLRIEVDRAITPDQLYSFYEKNNICETGFEKEVAARVLDHSSLIVGAFEGEELVGIARAMFDGLSATIMEFCLALRYQGEGLKHSNGSLIEKDPAGLGKRIGEALLDELWRMGATFVSCYIVANCEEPFYASIGFEENTGHGAYYIDRRPYVIPADNRGYGEVEK